MEKNKGKLLKREDIILKDADRQKCSIYTRVMGYHQVTDNFNIGKKQEFKDRKFFKESECKLGNA